MMVKSCNKGLQEEECVLKVGEHDVVFGRGGYSYGHAGNRLFRRLVQHNQGLYHTSKNANHRSSLAFSIVNAIHWMGGRFLRKQEGNSFWKPVSVRDACIKTSQALRDANVRTKKFRSGSLMKSSECQKSGSLFPVEAEDLKGPCKLIPPSESQEIVSARKIAQVPLNATTTEDGIDSSELEIIHAFAHSLATHPGKLRDITTLRSSFKSWISSQSENPTRRSFVWQSAPSCDGTISRRSFDASWSDLLAPSCQGRDLQLDSASDGERPEPARSEGRFSVTSVSLLEAILLQDDFLDDVIAQDDIIAGDGSSRVDGNDKQTDFSLHGTDTFSFGLTPNEVQISAFQ